MTAPVPGEGRETRAVFLTAARKQAVMRGSLLYGPMVETVTVDQAATIFEEVLAAHTPPAPARPDCWCPNRSDGRRHTFLQGRGVGLCGEKPTPAPADREGPAGGLSEVIYDVLRGAGHGQCEGQDEPLDVTAARLATVRAPDAGLRAAKAEAWDEAHTQFCPWVRGFSGCTSHENPHRGEYTRAALATEDGA